MNLPRSVSLPAVALALAGATLVGCSPAPAPAPTPTPAFASEEEAFAAAEQTYRAYIAAFNAVDLRDPRSFEAVGDHSTGAYRADERKQLSEMHAKSYTRSGELVVVSFEGRQSTSNSVMARTCEDVSRLFILDSEGNSLVTADRPEYYALDVTFALSDGDLLIADAEAVEDPECGP